MNTRSTVHPTLDVLEPHFATLGLVVVDLASSGIEVPPGPFTVVLLRQASEVSVAIFDLANDDGVASVIQEAAQAAFPDAVPDMPIIASSYQEVGAQLAMPLQPYLVLREGQAIGLLAMAADRRLDDARAAVPQAGVPLDPEPRTAGDGVVGADYAMLKNVALEVTVELGRASMTLSQLLGLTIGSVIELDRAAGSPVDIRVNGTLFGRGEVVVVDDEYAVRIVEILSGGLGG